MCEGVNDRGIRLTPDGAGRGVLGVFEVEGSGVVTELKMVQGWSHELRRLLPPK